MSSERLLAWMRVADADPAAFAATLASVLAQEGVDFRLVVVDDASVACCTEAVASRADPRVSLVRNPDRRGVGHCRAQALEASSAPFVAEIPERAQVLPGALATLLAACGASPGIGLAHCFHHVADAEGRIRRDAFRAQRRRFLARFGPAGDVRRDLLAVGDGIGPLRLLRREACAMIAQPLPVGAGRMLADMVRLAARFEVVAVTECLLVLPAPAGPSASSPLRRIVAALAEAAAAARELRAERGRFARDRYDVAELLRTRLLRAAGADRLAALGTRARRWPRELYHRRCVPLGERIYFALVERLSPGAERLLPRAARPRAEGERRIAYYLWHFPVLSQTFVNRELAALVQAGVHVDVVADGADDPALNDHNAARLLAHTTYLHPADRAASARYRSALRARRPVAYLRVLLFTLACRYTQQKRFGTDLAVFAKAVHLAGVLREKGTTQLHAPWADQCAHVALMAARLLDIPYSVQARAHDIHRRSYQWGLRERLAPAAFVVTNTRYNESHLRRLLGARDATKVHVINNGVDLDRFPPALRPAKAGGRVGILCVARLIEQKGLAHLLAACAELARQGVDFACDVVGGPEEPRYTTHRLELARLHRKLDAAGRVRFLGAQPLAEVLGRLRDADLFVLPCVIARDGSRDITPNALIEAMAMGLPVVSTTVGGIPEIVEDGVSGLIVPPGDAAALAAALAALCRDPHRRAELGAAARRRVEDKFDIAKNVRRYVALFGGEATASPSTESAPRPALAPGD